MQDSNAPARIPLIWAASASAPYIRAIPTPSQVGIRNGGASFTDGFPPATFVSEASGGDGPFGDETNGILQQITAGLQWAQAGAPLPYDAGFSTAIGGSPKGAVIPSATSLGPL